MPVDRGLGNRNGNGLFFGNGNGLMQGPSMDIVNQAQQDQYNNLQLTGVGGGPVKSGKPYADINGNVTSPLIDSLGSGNTGRPKPPNNNGGSGMQNVLDFTDRSFQPPLPRNPIFGPPRELMNPKGGAGNGDYEYEEDLPPRPIGKNQRPNYTAPLLGEKKIM
jgi:hypothetical protein